MNRAAIIWCLLAVPLSAQELMRREAPIPTIFSPNKRPASAISDAAKRQAKAWLDKWAQDKPKGWKVSGWEYRGMFSGPMSEGKRWSMYRMSFNPPISDSAGSPQFEAWFGLDGQSLAFPREEYSRSLSLPRVPAAVEMPADSILGVRIGR